MIMEIWKDIPGLENMYQVSSLGRVRGLNRTTKSIDGRIFHIKGKILKQYKNSNGYLFIGFNLKRKKINIPIHQAVAMAFLGYVRNGKQDIIVDHINATPTDNRLENLQLISQRENAVRGRDRGNSKHVGVHFHQKNKKYESSIYHNGKRLYLGLFSDEKEASEYYLNALNSIKKGTEIKVKKNASSSKYKGVSWSNHNKKWRSRIVVNGSLRSLGCYKSEYQAHLAYQEAYSEINKEANKITHNV